jgi:hypothetical protein
MHSVSGEVSALPVRSANKTACPDSRAYIKKQYYKGRDDVKKKIGIIRQLRFFIPKPNCPPPAHLSEGGQPS